MSEEDDLIRWQVREQTATLRAEVEAWRERAERAERTRDAQARINIILQERNADLRADRDALRALLAEARAEIAHDRWSNCAIVTRIDAALREGK